MNTTRANQTDNQADKDPVYACKLRKVNPDK